MAKVECATYPAPLLCSLPATVAPRAALGPASALPLPTDLPEPSTHKRAPGALLVSGESKRPAKRATSGLTTTVTNPSSLPVTSPFNLRNDRLGTLVRELTLDLAAADSWEEFVSEFRGPSYLSPELEQVDHPAVPVLLE